MEKNEKLKALVLRRGINNQSPHLFFQRSQLKSTVVYLRRSLQLKSLFILILTSLISCNPIQTKLKSASSEIENAEKNLSEMSLEDWAQLKISMEELDQDLKINRKDYSEDQIKELKQIQGRYAAIILKKGLNELEETFKDLVNQMDGFIEGTNIKK